jgi:hypothetical protein
MSTFFLLTAILLRNHLKIKIFAFEKEHENLEIDCQRSKINQYFLDLDQSLDNISAPLKTPKSLRLSLKNRLAYSKSLRNMKTNFEFRLKSAEQIRKQATRNMLAKVSDIIRYEPTQHHFESTTSNNKDSSTYVPLIQDTLEKLRKSTLSQY